MKNSFYISPNPPTFEDLSASYTLAMEYDNLHNITNKTQGHTRDGALFTDNSYNHNYHYVNNKPHQLDNIQLGTSPDKEHFKYDGNGNMLYHDGGNNDWYYFWDEGNRLRSAVENGVKMTHFIYDAGGRTIKVEELSNDAGTIKTEFTYNAIGELLKVTDTEGNETESFYDLAGRRTELRHPDNGITKFTYDNASNLTAKEIDYFILLSSSHLRYFSALRLCSSKSLVKLW